MQLASAQGISQLSQLTHAGNRTVKLGFIELEASHECRSQAALLGLVTIRPIGGNDVSGVCSQ